jgi:DNA segregation ATPase FtsK/SpoIIIE, S-DNA-T family
MAPKTTLKPPHPGPDSVVEPPQASFSQRLADFLAHFARFFWDIAGVFCLALALMTALTLLAPSWTSGMLAAWGEMLRDWFGWGAIWVPVLVGLIGVWMFRSRTSATVTSFWGRFVLLELAAFASLGLLTAIGGIDVIRAEAGLDGGRLGWGLAELASLVFSRLGLTATFWPGLLYGGLLIIIMIVGLSLSRPVSSWLHRAAHPTVSIEPEIVTPVTGVIESPMPAASTVAPPLARRKPTPLPPQFRKNFRLAPEEATEPADLSSRNEALPPIDILVYEQYNRPDERTINQTAGLIEKTLADFGIPARVIDFRVGPTVTQFAVEPGYLEKDKNATDGEAAARQKVRVAQISSLARDLALALAAERLRIEAPVPGRPYVGIEVPNPRASVVRLRPMLESENFHKIGSTLAIALGRDVSGQPIVADLARMPHLLIAGTTGSGKSVCIASLTTCLVMNNTPDDLRLVMIDPKMVELVRFNGLPHLFGKVETDVERILTVLRWTVAEMDRRYKVLEASHSRNLDSYNRKAQRRKGMEQLPHLVVMIDELADLMMSAPDQTEHNLVRLAQMARATGIHLVVATQRPGTEVVTGLIKANFPARISFAVASSVDSRVILDTVGAESLLGHGDMLFLPPDASGPQRLQGVMVSDQEVERVINFWQKSLPLSETPEPSPWEEMLAEEEILADRDGLVERAIEIVRKEQRASASMLQRRLRIGYPRAARLVDELEELGVIGPAVGGGRDREVLVEPDEAYNDEAEWPD